MESITKTCRICNNSENNTEYTAREMMFGLREEFLYFQCKACDCLQISEFPNNMSKYYPENYYSFGEYKGGKFKGFFGKVVRKHYDLMVNGGNAIRKIMGLFSGNNYFFFEGLNINKNSKILDVGCGNSRNFLYPLAEIGFKNLRGCDPFLEVPLSYKNGLFIDNSNIFEIAGTWDIITYHHSFEHIPNPLEHLKRIYDILSPGGVCIVRIPTVSSFAWKHYGINWVQLDAPRHFFLHSIKSMEILGAQSKLELYQTIFDSTQFQFSGSEKYLNDIPYSASRPKGIMNFIRRKYKKQQYQKRAAILNKEGQGDQAAFLFRKPSS